MLLDALHIRVIENLNVAVFVFDTNFRVKYINPAAEMLCAISARQGKEMSSYDLFGGPNRLTAVLEKARDNGHPLTEREIELSLIKRNNITVDCTVTPLREPNQDEILIVELQQIDRQLRILRDEHLLQQQQATSAMVRGLAHEINNPLGGLRGAAQLLQRELPNESLYEYTRVIISEADRLQNLLARLLGPNTAPRKRLCNIHELIEHVRTLVSTDIPQAVIINRDYDPSIPELYLDADQIIQAVLNITRNAVQAMDEQGEIVLRTRTVRQFTIGGRRHKLALRIDIIDNGPGIPPAIAETLFFPMVSGRVEGTGLGLSIAQSLVNLHGGIIEFTSRPGNTKFTLLLPLDQTHG